MGGALFRRLWLVRSFATAWVGGTRVGYFVLFVVPSQALDLEFDDSDRTRIVALTCLYAVVAAPVSYRRAKREFAPVTNWLDSGNPPDGAIRSALLELPLRQAVGTVAYWGVGAACAATYYAVAHDPDPFVAVALVAGVTLLGLHAAMIVFLLAERLVQPLAPLVVAGEEPVRLRMLSVRDRYLLTWALGPGVSLAGVGIFLAIRSPDADGDLGRAILPIVLLALTEGCLLVWAASGTVTEPIRELREAMHHVSSGDLGSGVPVSATNEVGLLQIGFNDMVDGLRERDRLLQLLGEYVGDDVATLLTAESELHGTTVEASVLMVDLIGSTALAEQEPSHDVLATLNTMFDAVVRTTQAEGGWVNRFVGDAAVCVFGAPTVLDDHADRALRAARALHAELARLRRTQPALDAGIGVSSGLLTAGRVGGPTRHEFTVVGDPANEAARLTEQAKATPGRVLASSATLQRATTEASSWTPVGALLLRGRSAPTDAHAPSVTPGPLTRTGSHHGISEGGG